MTHGRGSAVRRFVVPGVLVMLLGCWPTPSGPAAQEAVSSSLAPAAVPRASRDWKALQSPNFVIAGNSSDGVLRNTAVQLEMFRDTVSQLFPAVRERSPVPTTVVVFRNDASFHEFKPRDPRGRVMDTVAGYLTTRPDANYIVLAARNNQTQTYRVVLHEFAHYLIHGAVPRVPRWLDEGLADFYSTIQIDTGDGQVRIGDAIRGHQVRLRGGLIIPLDRLLSARGESTIFGDLREQLTFYAQSWALVHYLTLGHGGKRDGQMESYLQAIAAGGSLAEAGQQAFGRDLRPLHTELATYVRRSTLPTRSLAQPSTERPDTALRPAPMSEAAVQALRIDLLGRVPVFRETNEALPGGTVENQVRPPTAAP